MQALCWVAEDPRVNRPNSFYWGTYSSTQVEKRSEMHGTSLFTDTQGNREGWSLPAPLETEKRNHQRLLLKHRGVCGISKPKPKHCSRDVVSSAPRASTQDREGAEKLRQLDNQDVNFSFKPQWEGAGLGTNNTEVLNVQRGSSRSRTGEVSQRQAEGIT